MRLVINIRVNLYTVTPSRTPLNVSVVFYLSENILNNSVNLREPVHFQGFQSLS